MARIRTIKPDIWTDEALTECSLSARLLFIGMFNFADDNGNLVNSPKKLKMQIFPADNLDCAPLIDELVENGLVISYSHGGSKYLNIKGFKKHQVINRPSKTDIPEPPQITEHSLSTHGVLTDGRERKGKERKGKESASEDKSSSAHSSAGSGGETLSLEDEVLAISPNFVNTSLLATWREWGASRELILSVIRERQPTVQAKSLKYYHQIISDAIKAQERPPPREGANQPISAGYTTLTEKDFEAKNDANPRV